MLLLSAKPKLIYLQIGGEKFSGSHFPYSPITSHTHPPNKIKK